MDLPRFMVLALLIVPVAAAIVVAVLGPRRIEPVRWISLGASLVTLALAAALAGHFIHLEKLGRIAGPPKAATNSFPTFHPEFVPGSPTADLKDPGRHSTTWDIVPIGKGAIQFYVGFDGLNIWLVVLTAVLMVPSVLVSWNAVTERVNEFYAWLLALQTGMMGVFMAFDIVLFYVFFELTLVPLFFLIGIWGGPDRRYAAVKFFLYTLAGSLITLLGVIGVVVACYTTTQELTFSLPRLVTIVHQQLPIHSDYWGSVQFWVFLSLMAGFAVKVPLVPFHTWLPLAHVEAPTAGSVDLAGVLLKIGAYGFLRLCVPLAPDVSLSLGLPLVSTLAAVGIVYGAFCAYSQNDIKRLIAYSSVSHLGLCMLAMFALNVAGLSGSLLQMVNHGLATGALFLLIGMMYERYHTRKLADYGGMAARMPLLAAFMVFVCLSSVGLPGLNGFIGEVLCLMGIFARHWAWAVVGASGLILGAWYLFTMLRSVFFGPLKEPEVPGHDDRGPVADLSFREVMTLAPILALCLLIGVYPQPMLSAMRPDVETVADIAERARQRVDGVAAAQPADTHARTSGVARPD